MVKTSTIIAWTMLKSSTSPAVSWKIIRIRALIAKRRGAKPECLGEWEKKGGAEGVAYMSKSKWAKEGELLPKALSTFATASIILWKLFPVI